MKKVIAINGRNISVLFTLYAIRIYNDDNEVTQLLKTEAKTKTDKLVTEIKTEYFKQFKQAFTVSDASMSIEIWGHVHIEKFAKAIKSFLPVKLVCKLSDKIIFHCQEIDIGEKGHDNNRFVWDWLVPFKHVIARILFYKQGK